MTLLRITTCVAAGLFAAAALPASAQSDVGMPTSGELMATLELRGDVQRGKQAYAECQSCHRRDGSGRANGGIPRLSGQHASVLIKQIMDIRSGARINPEMKDFVVDPALTLQHFADIAAYLRSLPVAGSIGRGPDELVARGKDLFAKDCSSCHGERGEGRAELFQPMVASQHYGYLVRELKAIREGGRGNSNPVMAAVLKGYSPDDQLAVAAYLAQLPPPARP
jgi:cytochrome c553